MGWEGWVEDRREGEWDKWRGSIVEVYPCTRPIGEVYP